jgi:glycyl-tRNA synthetase (class II)
VDGQTHEDGTVTVRDRDSLDQIRLASDNVVDWIRDRLGDRQTT